MRILDLEKLVAKTQPKIQFIKAFRKLIVGAQNGLAIDLA